MSCRTGTLCIVHLQGTYTNVIDVHHPLGSSLTFCGFLLSLNSFIIVNEMHSSGFNFNVVCCNVYIF